jgi:hypothetical protein
MQTPTLGWNIVRLSRSRRPLIYVLIAALSTLGIPGLTVGKEHCNQWLPGCSLDLRPAFEENHTPQLVAGAVTIGAAVMVAVLLHHKGRAAPKMRVTASDVSFRGVQVGNSADQSLTLRNEGEGPVTISAIRLSGPSFSVVNPPELPIAIPGRSQVSIGVSFAPRSAQKFSGKIEVVTVSPAGAKGQTKLLKVKLKGEGLRAQQASR